MAANQLNSKYAEVPGKHARRAADLGARGEFAKSKKHADMAVQEQDVMHPDLWVLWDSCDAGHFALCLEKISPKEIAKLQAAKNSRGWDVAVRLGSNVPKISTLMGKGLVIEDLVSNIGEAQLPTAYVLAFQGNVRGLLGLVEAGVGPPERIGLEQAQSICKVRPPRTLLHALARAQHMSVGVMPSDWDILAEWALRSESIRTRNSEGQDVLKVAIGSGHAELAIALVRAGADLMSLDSKFRSVNELLALKIKEYERHGPYEKSRILAKLAPELLAAKEKKIIDASAEFAKEPIRRSMSL